MAQYPYGNRNFRVGKLGDELLAAIPACRPAADASGTMQAQSRVDAGPVDQNGVAGAVTVTVPDSVTKAQVDAVVNAHDATTPGQGELAYQQDQTSLSDFAAQYQAALTQAQDDRTRLVGGQLSDGSTVAATNWDALTAAQRTQAMARMLQRQIFVLKALRALSRRAGS